MRGGSEKKSKREAVEDRGRERKRKGKRLYLRNLPGGGGFTNAQLTSMVLPRTLTPFIPEIALLASL